MADTRVDRRSWESREHKLARHGGEESFVEWVMRWLDYWERSESEMERERRR